jgi:hypothetical protein
MDGESRPGAIPRIPAESLAPGEARVIQPAADATRETLQRMLAKLDIPRDYAAVLGVWPRAAGRVEVHLSPGSPAGPADRDAARSGHPGSTPTRPAA